MQEYKRCATPGIEKFRVTVARPDDLRRTAEHGERVMRLLLAGRIPESIRGWMIVNLCRRLLRNVYGSNLEAAAALRAIVLDEEREAVRPTVPAAEAPNA